MRTAVDVAAELAERIAGPGFDAPAFAVAYQRALPGLVLYDAQQFVEPDDPVEYARLRRRNEALDAVVAELTQIGIEPTAQNVSEAWGKYVGSLSARRWRALGGPDADANELDALLYLLTLHNGGDALSERRLRDLIAERAAERRSAVAGTSPLPPLRSCGLGSPGASAQHPDPGAGVGVSVGSFPASGAAGSSSRDLPAVSKTPLGGELNSC